MHTIDDEKALCRILRLHFDRQSVVLPEHMWVNAFALALMMRTLVYPFSIMELVSLRIPPGLMSRAIEPGVQSLASTLSPSVRYTLACGPIQVR